MKRYLITLICFLFCLLLKSQSLYTCHYWFDENHTQMAAATFHDGLWQTELDVGTLSPGIHLLYVQVKDSTGIWCPPQSYMFYKAPTEIPVSTGDVAYHCWFDQDIEHKQSGPFQTGQFLLDVSGLDSGIHMLYVMLESNGLSSAQSYMFYKAPTEIPVSTGDVVYHCWFDQDIEHKQSGPFQTGQFLLDVSGLDSGIHMLYVMLDGNGLSSAQSYMFYKAPVESPVNTGDVVYHCWFDQDFEHKQSGSFQSGQFLLDASGLDSGIHMLYVMLEGNGLSSAQSYMFYKKSEKSHIARWEYWVNDDFNNRHTTNLSPEADTLEIMALLPVGSWPIRSSCFHFHPNGDEPYINPKNEINFRFWDTKGHVFNKSALFVDENVSESIIAEIMERNTITTIPAPRDNQIHWFKVLVNRGDYLSFQADKACSMQLFAPSGEEVYNVSGSESIQEISFNAWEDGNYYLAVHDVTGSGETVSITYNWIYRYSILAYDVHLVGNGGCSTITFQGNGFNSLLDAYLVNAQNDTIRNLYIGHESNTTATVTFDFYQVNLGVYNAVFQFYDEAMHINGAMEVQEPTDILLTSSVSYPSVFLKGTTVTYSYTITNNGNMSAYGIPLYLYISSPTLESITHLELEGLGLFSLADYLNLDSIPYDYVEIINEWANNQGDDHYFYSFSEVENKQGDTVAVRSNFFFVNLAPFESKTIKLKITASIEVNQSIEVLMTVPNDIITPYTTTLNRETGKFCCVMQHITCFTSILAAEANSIGFWVDALSLAFPEIIEFTLLYHAASCIVSLVHAFAETVDAVFCNEEQGILNKIMWSLNQSNQSLIAMALNCLPSFQNLETAANALNPYAFNDLFDHSIYAIGDIVRGKLSETNIDCGFTEETIDCFQGTPQGGKSKAVNSLDPNDILGYLSESGSHYMRPEIQNVQYEIEFENDTTLATAAAHTIIVRDTLDASKFDLNSLAAHSVTIGDKRLELNGEQNFARTLDMRPELYVIAQIEQDYDPSTGIIQWTIQSLDPMTMEPTNDPNQGVLPVNYNGDGVGFIDYSINLKEAFADGTAITNRAGIIFDQNDVIMTPTWTNTVDAVKPTSHIEEVTPVADSLSFSFVSEDNRSGVWYHSLYYRNASTEQEWQVRKAQIFEDSFVLHLEDLLTTEYLVIAVDSAGNREDKDMVAEYIYTASGLHFVSEGNWSTASNWQEGTLPEADDVAFINAPCQLDQDAEVAALAISDDQTLTVQSGKTLTVNGLLFNPSAEGLVIEDGAQLINATSNVAATMEKGIAAYPNSGPDGWYTIASPMDEMPIAESDFLTPNFDLYRFDETNLTHEEWQNYKANHPDFTTFEMGRGYLYANSNSFAPAFMGTLSNTAATYHLTYTERPDALSGFNLIGNPFPHVIYKGAGGAIDNAQLASGYYTLTNEGAWHVHTYEDAIMPGQGILVKTMAGLDLTIAKSNATALSESSNAKASSSRVVLKVSGSWGEDRAFVYFGQGIGLDKMENLSRTVPSLWIRDNGHDYAIAHVDSDCESLELFFSNMQSGDFTLSVDVSDTSFSVLQLTDRITGVTIDLLQQPSYVFHSAGQENEARFSLTFKMETMR